MTSGSPGLSRLPRVSQAATFAAWLLPLAAAFLDLHDVS
jgi:hypothetical protein